MNKIKKYIRLTYGYSKSNITKNFIICGIVFFAAMIVGFFAMFAVPDEVIKEITKSIGDVFDSKRVITDGGNISFIGLLLNNLLACFMMFILGFIPFLFLPVFYEGLNGMLVGVVLGIIHVMGEENGLIAFVKFILPHGIFEIPAMVLAGAIGLKLCVLLCRKIFGKAREEKLSCHIKGCLGIYVTYIIPLLIAAAFIEGVVLELLYV